MVWDTHGEDMIVKFDQKVLSNEVNDIAWDARNEKFMVVGTGSNLYGRAFTIDGSSAGEASPEPPIDANGKVTGHTGLNGTVVINAVAISPNAITSSLPSRAVTVGDDQQMGFYKGPRYRWITTYKQHTGFVYDASFSPDGMTIVTVGQDRKINLFSGEDGSFRESFDGADAHNGSIFSVGWDPTGSQIVTASADRTVKLWDVATKSVVQ
jgi:WD repeat-containing protein 1 (actin-interacting protein 1)